MATRGSALSRTMAYFRTADLDEVRVAFQLAKEIVDGRLNGQTAQMKLPLAKKARKPVRRPAAVSAPVDRIDERTAETLANA